MVLYNPLKEHYLLPLKPKKKVLKGIIIPIQNVKEAAIVEELDVYGFLTLLK